MYMYFCTQTYICIYIYLCVSVCLCLYTYTYIQDRSVCNSIKISLIQEGIVRCVCICADSGLRMCVWDGEWGGGGVGNNGDYNTPVLPFDSKSTDSREMMRYRVAKMHKMP